MNLQNEILELLFGLLYSELDELAQKSVNIYITQNYA